MSGISRNKVFKSIELPCHSPAGPELPGAAGNSGKLWDIQKPLEAPKPWRRHSSLANHTFVTVNTQQSANDKLFVAFIPCMQNMKLGVVLLPAGL